MMLPKPSRECEEKHLFHQFLGFGVLRALKADVHVKHIPVIVLSGLGQANETQALEGGRSHVFGEIFGEQFIGSDSGSSECAGRNRSANVAASGLSGLTIVLERTSVAGEVVPISFRFPELSQLI
jgi:hypothetical protein